MDKVRLGKTELMVTKTAFGALPMQRVSMDDAKALLTRAYEAGINYFDTARAYTDSEEKIGFALRDVRKSVIISTKTGADTKKQVLDQLQTSLDMLKTDYIDIYQLHNPRTLPNPDDPDSSYAGMVEAKKKGYVRHIGITNHSAERAIAAAESGLYETVQYPFSYLCSELDAKVVDVCQANDVGFIAMKALSGGLITNAAAAFAFMQRYGSVVPIWGIQRMEELKEFIALDANHPTWDAKIEAQIAADRKELTGSFCRGCGYCMPCPVGIEIPTNARMSLLLRRSPTEGHLSEVRQQNMRLIEQCKHCGHCSSQCPYHLDTPALLAQNLKDYLTFLS